MQNNKNNNNVVKSSIKIPNIEEELRAICAPCKNSNLSYIRIICEKALLNFRHYKDLIKQSDGVEYDNLRQFPITDVCSACREAIIASIKHQECGNLSILGMNCLQQILIPGLLDTYHKITILAVLNEVSIKVSNSMKTRNRSRFTNNNLSMNNNNILYNNNNSFNNNNNNNSNNYNVNNEKEQILIKVIQMVLLFLDPEILEFNEAMITLLVSIISSFFNLSGHYQLIQMSQLAIRQLINISLDLIYISTLNNDEEMINNNLLKKSFNDDNSLVIALLLIKDISIMIDKKVIENVELVTNSGNLKDNNNFKSLIMNNKDELTPLSLLKGGITIPSDICLDIWYEILDSNNLYRKNLLDNNDDLKSLIYNVLFPSLSKCIQRTCKDLNPDMSQNMYDFVMFARFIRLLIRIMEYNSNKNTDSPYIKNCICNSLMSLILTISIDNFSKIPSWSLQCILEMFGELIQNSNILILIGNINIKNYYQDSCLDLKSDNLLEILIINLNKILVFLNDQLDLLQSTETTFNLSVPSFLNENITLPNILLPQNNNSNIECGYFIIGCSKKNTEKSVRLIDIIMEDDRIYHISKYNFDNDLNKNKEINSIQNWPSTSSIVLISLKPIEISILVFDIIINFSSCLNRIYINKLMMNQYKTEFEDLICNIWDSLYQLIKQCMNYHLLRYYLYRIITFLFELSSSSSLKGKLKNILCIITEAMQIYYDNNKLIESRILYETIIIEKIFSIYKCYLSISYQYSEHLDEIFWQYLFRYMEYIDRILDIGLGSMIKSNESLKSKTFIEANDTDNDHLLIVNKNLDNLTINDNEVYDFKNRDDKVDDHIMKTLMAESTILRASHEVFLKEHIKKVSESTINRIIKGIYRELSFNIYKENIEIRIIDYLLVRLSNIIKCIYDQMSYELFIPIWNDKIIPLLLDIMRYNNDSNNFIQIKNKNIENKNSDDNKSRIHFDKIDSKINQINNVEIFNSIINFLSSTITTIFKYIDTNDQVLINKNIQTSLLNPYLMLINLFPNYNTILVRSLYSIMCSTIPKLDESTWILIITLINNIVENNYSKYIKYLKYEKLKNEDSTIINGSLLFFENNTSNILLNNDDENNDIELFQAIFLLVEFLCDETEIHFFKDTKKISSSWNLLIESIAIFGRMNTSVENIAFQAVSLLWKLTDLIGSLLIENQQKYQDQFENQQDKEEFNFENLNCSDSYQLIINHRNVTIYKNASNNIYYSNFSDIDIIWLNVILQLEDLCKDPRQEIRNCSLKSLYSTLIKHCKHIYNKSLQNIIIFILKNVLLETFQQYQSSLFTQENYESLFNDQLEFEFEFNNSLCDENQLQKQQTNNSYSSFSNLLYKNQQYQFWEITLGITIDGTFRIVKELSTTDRNDIYYECTLFLFDIISSILSSVKDPKFIIGKEIQIISIKILFELLIISLKKNDNEFWNKAIFIYSNIFHHIVSQSYETLNKIQNAETFVENKLIESENNDLHSILYKNYNNYVNKLSKYYLSDKLAETILQTVVDLILNIKDSTNIEHYLSFNNSFNQIFDLLNLVIAITTSINTFIHYTISLENLDINPDSDLNHRNILINEPGNLYKEFKEYKEFNYNFINDISLMSWGKNYSIGTNESNKKSLFIPKLINYEKDREILKNKSKKLIYIENYNNSDFIHKGYYKNLKNISLLNVLPEILQERDTELPNIVYLLRNIKYSDMWNNSPNFSYYIKSKEIHHKEENLEIDSPPYLCSIRNNNDFLSSGTNNDIRFITTIQNMSIEILQLFLNSLPSYIIEHYINHLSKINGQKINYGTNFGDDIKMLIPIIFTKLIDSLILHLDTYKDTCKIGIACKTISLIVGFNRNIILDCIRKIKDLKKNQVIQIENYLIREECLLIQTLRILPYIFDKLLNIILIDDLKIKSIGLWMVAKEAILIISHDWISLITFMKREFIFDKMYLNEIFNIIKQFDEIIQDNLWPLLIETIIILIDHTSELFNELITIGQEYCLYYDILMLNVASDLILSLDNTYKQVFNFSTNETDYNDIILELPLRYYLLIIKSLDEFIDKINNISNSNILNNTHGHNSNSNSFNINKYTLKMYTIERIFELYDFLISKNLLFKIPHTDQYKDSFLGNLTPILYNRISKILINFSMEDIQNGLRPLPRLKIDEIHTLLDFIQKHYFKLSADNNINKDIKRYCLKQLLTSVLPNLIECTTSKDQSIRQHLKNILKPLVKDLVIKSFE